MIVRIPRHTDPRGFVRIETRLLPGVGETIAVDTDQGRIVYKIREVGEGDEPLLATLISEGDPDHFGRPVDDQDAALGREDDLDDPLGLDD